jgi:hypothetical protein
VCKLCQEYQETHQGFARYEEVLDDKYTAYQAAGSQFGCLQIWLID